MPDLEANYKRGIADGLNIKAIVVINPGNPTGQVMSLENLKDVKSAVITSQIDREILPCQQARHSC